MQSDAEESRGQATLVCGSAKQAGGDALEDSDRSHASQTKEHDRIDRVQSADGGCSPQKGPSRAGSEWVEAWRRVTDEVVHRESSFIGTTTPPGVHRDAASSLALPYRFRDRSLALAASTSRFRGDAVVVSDEIS